MRKPRKVSHESKGDATPPAAICTFLTIGANSFPRLVFGDVVTIPINESECPAKYFVPECNTTSAPSYIRLDE